jgi:hypothetical protein
MAMAVHSAFVKVALGAHSIYLGFSLEKEGTGKVKR